MKKILITPRSLTKDGHPALEKLRKAGYELVFSKPGQMPTEEELIELIKGCIGYLAGVEKITKSVLRNADELKVISRNGAGIDNIDIDEAKRRNIRIFRAEGANARGVAELTIGFILSLARSIPFHDSRMKKTLWKRKKGIEIKGKTLGVIGCGKIGKEVAEMALGIGMNVLAYDIYIDKSFKPGDKFRYTTFNELISKSDIITIHMPGSQDGRPVISPDEIKSMKKGAFLINTARANLVDTRAVIEALDKDIMNGYAVDVYLDEPPVGAEIDLIQREDIIATPHIGGYTEESVNRATEAAVDNLLKYLG